MSLHPKKFCLNCGLQFDKTSNVCFGTMGGFTVFAAIAPRRDSVVFRLIAKLPETVSEGQVQSAIAAFSQSRTGVSAMQYQERCLAAILSLTPRDTDSNLTMRVAEMVQFAAEQGMIPCCMSCGAETGYRSYLLDGTGITLCDPCKPYLEQKMLEERAEKAMIRPNYGGIVFGALLGAAVVFLLTFFVLKMSYLSMLTGFAGIILGLHLMRKLGKKITPLAAGICAVLCLAASVCATFVHFAEAMADYNYENAAKASEVISSYAELQDTYSQLTSEEKAQVKELYGDLDSIISKDTYELAKTIKENDTVGKCLSNFWKLLSLSTYRDLKPEVIKCLLFSLISIIGGVLATAPKLIQEDRGAHKLRELPL